MTEEERKKEELQNDENFKKYLTMYKVKIPVINVKLKMKDEGIFDP